MKKITAPIIAAMIALATIATPAHAVQATLISCENGQSVGGKFGWIGLYEAHGAQGTVQFTKFFSSYCPYSINVY